MAPAHPEPAQSTPPPPPRPATLVALQTLERVSRDLLVRLLAPHAAFFASHGVALDALAATAQTDRALVRRVHDALHAPPPHAPDDALASLALALHHLARGRDAILALDTGDAGDAPRFPRGSLSNEDLAARALLDAPELAAEALEACSGASDDAQLRGTTELEPADARPLACDAAFTARFVDLFGERMKARDRKRYCDLYVRETQTAIHLEIAHGKVPAARDFVRDADAARDADADADAAADTRFVLAQSTDVVTERARARICKTTGRMSLKAAHPAIKEVLRRTLGEVAFGNANHWRSDATCSLQAFSHLETALACDDVPGLASVELHGFAVHTADDETIEFSRPRKSLMTTSAKEVHAAALLLGNVVFVKLALKLDAGAKVSVRITVKRGDNRVDYPRDDAETDRVVREYLIARGVMRTSGETALAATA